jgi:hypothetical protein
MLPRSTSRRTLLSTRPSRLLPGPVVGLVAALTALVVGLLATLGSPAARAGADEPAPAGGAYHLKIATFNVLGSQHTRRRGGMAPGTTRARYTARVIREKRIDVLGMQEVQEDQYRVLRSKLPGYGIWPGVRLGNQGIRLQIAWRKDKLELRKTGYIYTLFDHQRRPIPFVRLRDKQTGRAFFFTTFHNSPLAMEAERQRATRTEIGLLRGLMGSRLPVFMGADTNERTEFFCQVAPVTRLEPANGATLDPCRVPEHAIIDWIMGNTAKGGAKVTFDHYRQSRERLVRSSSDHHFVSVVAHVARANSTK